MKIMRVILKISVIIFVKATLGFAQCPPSPINSFCSPNCGSTCDYYVCDNKTESTRSDLIPVPFVPAAGTCEHKFIIPNSPTSPIVDRVPFNVTHVWKENCQKRTLSGPHCDPLDSRAGSGVPQPIMGVPVFISLTPTCNSISAVWSSVLGALNYKVNSKSVTDIYKTVTSTSYVFSGLTEDTNYTASVQACGLNGCGSSASQVVKTQLCTIASPVISSISPGCGKITVVWNSVSGAVKYRVMLTPGGSYETTNLNYVFSDLPSNSTYKVSVQACANSGTCSDVATRTETTLPVASCNALTACPLPKVVFTAPTNTGSSSTLEYKWQAMTGVDHFELLFTYKGCTPSWNDPLITLPGTATSYVVDLNKCNSKNCQAQAVLIVKAVFKNTTGVCGDSSFSDKTAFHFCNFK